MAPRDVTDDEIIDYLAQAVRRASAIFSGRPASDPAHALALGEAVALFNLADEFGLIERLRTSVDDEAGFDVYRRLSEAMKAFYLGGAERPPDQARSPAPRDRAPGGGPGPRGPRPGQSSRPPAQRPRPSGQDMPRRPRRDRS